MAKSVAGQQPLKFKAAHKTDIRAQFAALCWREKRGELQFCLITSRTRKRWIIPKGWPMQNQTPGAAAAQEAFEEGGLSGKAGKHSLGVYTYIKIRPKGTFPVVVVVYPLHVRNVHSDWPEKNQRKRKWFSQKKAVKKLSERELKSIVASFSPHRAQKQAKPGTRSK